MAEEPKITQLFATVVQWAITQGAENIGALPGLWTGETAEWKVKLNGHPREIEDVPPYGFLLTHKTAFVGFAIGNATDGAVAGPSENELIAHFQQLLPGVADG
ncbi:hypothetical protein [Nostoc phage Nsp-JY21]